MKPLFLLTLILATAGHASVDDPDKWKLYLEEDFTLETNPRYNSNNQTELEPGFYQMTVTSKDATEDDGLVIELSETAPKTTNENTPQENTVYGKPFAAAYVNCEDLPKYPCLGKETFSITKRQTVWMRGITDRKRRLSFHFRLDKLES